MASFVFFNKLSFKTMKQSRFIGALPVSLFLCVHAWVSVTFTFWKMQAELARKMTSLAGKRALA